MLNRRKRMERIVSDSGGALSSRQIRMILRTLPYEKAFHFHEDVGRPTGQYASSLLDFREKISAARSVQARASVVFHLRRGDFSKWTRDVLQDRELAKRISQIDPNEPGFRMKLYVAVETRISQLKEMLQTYTIIPEDSEFAHIPHARNH